MSASVWVLVGARYIVPLQSCYGSNTTRSHPNPQESLLAFQDSIYKPTVGIDNAIASHSLQTRSHPNP
ncbi:MAG: hypothetical protein LDL41_03790 [Coleofasciculus sp. S288]|nr:hypothetical protein [Coleofasciculus sp. S288]